MNDEVRTAYRVVINDDEQYSIWPQASPIPAGWRDEGFAGSEDECLAHIEEVWVDMRPLSVRLYTSAGTSK
ncbi:MbtH family protein [Micromonospora ureilytica]|uniref:MbtH protein n=1 Tax=Micromonospora ureilytica TaxID=709868 RepID=A0ABS0JRI9_9ACTN|nr:MbtH family NRPS accessory protein [Micromonospora ureilytica]MBG6069644.1 MbtH protein [Micromonospora ureilytica]WSR57113.1 MbtH family NRPS accessory protein [Micromonospora ureilytica]